jgi:protein tyrosine/serine phosphatase
MAAGALLSGERYVCRAYAGQFDSRLVSGDRHLDWDGCFNVRDLGGIRTAGGREIRQGAVVRGDAPDRLTPGGWAALESHGIRTIIDLRNDDELRDLAPRPAGLTALHLPLDGIEHREFWDLWTGGPQFATPVYLAPHIERFPERSARVVAAIAHAQPGGVLFHCIGGRDRTGQIAMLVLALLGVAPGEIAADYALSASRLRARYARLGGTDQAPEIEEFLAAKGTTAAEVVAETARSLDLDAFRQAGGLTDDDLAALQARVFAP